MYRDIPSFKEYIVVDPDKTSIEAFHINALGIWELKEYRNITETLQIRSIKISLKLSIVYEGTKVVLDKN